MKSLICIIHNYPTVKLIVECKGISICIILLVCVLVLARSDPSTLLTLEGMGSIVTFIP